MRWTDEGLILDYSAYGEGKSIMSVFTKDHGICRGMVRSSKKTRSFQPGSDVQVSWFARREDSLGSFGLELIKYRDFFDSRFKLHAMQLVCQLLKSALPDRDPDMYLYEATQRLWVSMEALSAAPKASSDWLADYLRWEFDLLLSLGLELALDDCCQTGDRVDLTYVSPKTGRAVSQAIGRPYHDKLLPYPGFLLTQMPTDWLPSTQVFRFFAETGAELNQNVIELRDRFVQLVNKKLTV
jgi:DNA repair protein RecO (recombination protein O)